RKAISDARPIILGMGSKKTKMTLWLKYWHGQRRRSLSKKSRVSMSIEQIGALCANTPTLTACDARGLTVRAVAYHRAPEAEGIAERITRHRYDAAGQLISSIDPKLSKQVPETGKAEPQPNWGTAYSLSGRTLRTDSVDAGWRLHWYGAAGQVLQTIDARRTCTRMEYDGLLRPIAILEKMQDDQERCVECFTYGASDMDPQLNLRGRLIRHDDPAGTLTISGYALTGQPLDETRYFLKTSDASNWPNTIEDRNRLLEGTEGHPVHTTCWFHNALGELLIQEDAQNNQQYFTYNIAGQLQTASVKLRDSEENKMVVEARIYNASGQVLQETAGNSVVTKYTYDPKTQQLSSVHTLRPATSDHSPELQHLQYYYDPVGNILGIEDKTPRSKFFDNQEIRATATYTYDTLYQLVKATGREHAGAVQGSAAPTVKIIPHAPDTYVNYTRTYAYDAGGNLTLIKGETGAVPFTQKMTVAKGSNRLASVSGLQTGDNMSLLTFDPNGNPASLSTGQALVWDARNQLCRVTAVNRLNKPDDEENYQYDGSGQRVRKTTRALANGETLAMRSTEVIYLPGLEIRRCYDINNTLSEELHVISVGAAGRAQVRIQHWAKPKRQLEQMPPQDQFRYSLGNHLGSSTLELDQAADILSYEEYYPFGGTAIWAAKSQIEAKYKVVRYSGKEQDATGLYYYGLRYYAPWLGRWLNPDPAGTVD
ncbi:putative insecticidal toxin, partial [Podila epicladia]